MAVEGRMKQWLNMMQLIKNYSLNMGGEKCYNGQANR